MFLTDPRNTPCWRKMHATHHYGFLIHLNTGSDYLYCQKLFLSRAKRRDFISNTNIFQRNTWVVQTLVNLFLETGGPGVLVLGGNPLSPNSSETAWNIQTPLYRMDTDSLRMVYVNFHKPICHRDFSMTVFY